MSEGKQEARVCLCGVYHNDDQVNPNCPTHGIRQANQPQFEPLVHEVCCHCGHSCQPQEKAQPESVNLSGLTLQEAFQRGQQAMGEKALDCYRTEFTDHFEAWLKQQVRSLASTEPPHPITDHNPDIREIAFDFVGDLGLPEHRSKEWLGERTERLIKRIVAVVNKYRQSAEPPQGEAEKEGRT